MSWLTTYFIIAWIIRIVMVPAILARQMAPGASIAWLGIIFLHPYIGLTLYAAIGETRLGPRRTARHRALMSQFRSGARDLQQQHRDAVLDLQAPYEPMVLQAEKISGLPVLGDNSVEFLPESSTMVDRLVADIDAARSQVYLLYYIFAPDGTGERVAAALERAAGRGIACRVLVDAVASRVFFHRRALARRLRAAGVEVAAALPVAPIQRRLPRMDLRNHRKLAILDSTIAYAGSHNLVNPDYGGRRGAPWVDLTGRFTGPVVDELSIVFAEDWAVETGQVLDAPTLPRPAETPGGTPMQVVPTGPSAPGETYRRLLLAAIQSARSRLILTTPYFVPDETTLVALLMAADRGVDVALILPERPDHIFTAAAGRAHFARLLDAGIAIHLYRPGLLHAKTTTIDDAFALFGSANLDVRSFNLNFELSLLLYGPEITARLRAIQVGYLADSHPLD
ncbi:MAG: cardiolipin synthase, partial [Tepidisphaerales bacterium]